MGRGQRRLGRWAVLALLAWIGSAGAQVTVLVDSTQDPLGSNGPGSGYSHHDRVNPYRGQTSFREALHYANPVPVQGNPGHRAKIGRRLANAVNSRLLSNQDSTWSSDQMLPAGPYTAASNNVAGAGSAWTGLGLLGVSAAAVRTLRDQQWATTNVTFQSPVSANVQNNVTRQSATLQLTNFGFSIPSGATITGVRVEIARHADPFLGGGFRDFRCTAITDDVVQLVRGGALLGANQARAGAWPDEDTFNGGRSQFANPPGGPYSPIVPQPNRAGGYGQNGNTWGATLTPNDVNDATFGVAIRVEARFDGVAGSVQNQPPVTVDYQALIDYVRVTVYVNPTPVLSTLTRADDTLRAAAALAGSQTSERLVFTDWGFDRPSKLVPDNAEVVGVAARIVRSCSAVTSGGTALQQAVVDDEVRLVTGRLGYSPANRADPTNKWPFDQQNGYEPTADITGQATDGGIYGADSDLWGFAPGQLTGADINSPTFGVAIRARDDGTNDVTGSIAHVNYVELSVFYRYDEQTLATITFDSPRQVQPSQWGGYDPVTGVSAPVLTGALPFVTRSNLTIDGEINGDGQADFTVDYTNVSQNQAPAGVLRRENTDGTGTGGYNWRGCGLRVGGRVGVGGTEVAPSNVVLDGINFVGSNITNRDSWVPGLWLYAGDNLKVVNTSSTGGAIGILSAVAWPGKVFIGSQSPGTGVRVSGNIIAGIYCVGSGQTAIQNCTVTLNGTTPGGVDPYSANIVLAGCGDNVVGGTSPGAANTVTGTLVLGALAGNGYGITVPGTGQNTIQNTTITNHAAPGIWIAATEGFPGRGPLPARSRPYPTIVGGSGSYAGCTVLLCGRTAGAWEPAGVLITGWAGDDSENPSNSPYAGEYNIIQGCSIRHSGGSGVVLAGPGKTRIGGVDPNAANGVTSNGELQATVPSVAGHGIELRTSGEHWGDARHPVTTARPDKVWANIIENNQIGTTGQNRGDGIAIIGNDDNLIGGTQAASRNIIANNGMSGVRLQGQGSNKIIGNYIGVTAAGTAALANDQNGIEIATGANGANLIGGTALAERNVISGNTGNGISILGSGNNRIWGNYIGLAANGTATLGNGINAIAITQQATGQNIVGGSQPGQRNFLCGSTQFGISLEGDAHGQTNLVRGNFIGISDTVAGDAWAAGNAGGGVHVNCAVAQQIGGSTLGEGNFIAANGTANADADGIELSGAGDHRVLGNTIGGRPVNGPQWPADARLLVEGSNYNGGCGILIDAACRGNIAIGGSGVNDGNVIVQNRQHGVSVAGTGIATLYGNKIGIGLDTNNVWAAMRNIVDGVLISGGRDNVVGASGANQGNAISANGRNGVNITGAGNNRIVGNRIGTNDAGDTALGNGDGPGYHGVVITGTGTNQVRSNTISANTGAGVYFNSPGTLRVAGNFIGTNAVADPLTGVWRATAALGNRTWGVVVATLATGTLHLSDGAANYIGGNLSGGVQLTGGAVNEIRGNVIGVGSDGVTDLGNGGPGILVNNFVQSHGTLGATTDVQRGVITWGNAITDNTIGGNTGAGVSISAGSTVIWNNRIGLGQRADGTAAVVGNQSHGILINDASLLTNRQNVVIGAFPEQGVFTRVRNVIVGNGGDGIRVAQAGGDDPTTWRDDVLVRGNWIGWYPNLTGAGNTGAGLSVQRAVNGRVQIGNSTGDFEVQRNVIAGNGGWGIDYQAQFTATPSVNNTPLIYNNYIGLGDDGQTAAGNRGGGVRVDVADAARVVGIGDDGTGTGRGGLPFANLIAANGGPGIALTSPVTANVRGNYIGLARDGVTVAGNGQEGILANVAPGGRANIGGTDGQHRLRNLIVGNGLASTAGQAFYAVRGNGGVVVVEDNLVGANEDGARNPRVLVGGGNEGGGVFLGTGVASGSVVADNTVHGSGGSAGFAGVRVDAAVPVRVGRNDVRNGTGPGVQVGGGAIATVEQNTVVGNLGEGVVLGGAGNHIVSNNQILTNGAGAVPRAGMLLAGPGSYKVYRNTIEGSGGDGLTLGTATVAVNGAWIGLQQSSEWTNNDGAGGAAPATSNANRIDRNGGWGLNAVNGAGNRLSGNIVYENVGGGISQGPIVAPVINGLHKFDGVSWQVAGRAPAGARVEVYEARDLDLARPGPTGHAGQPIKRFVAVTADAEGNFSASVDGRWFLEPDDDLKLVTALAIDPLSSSTSAYARNTGRPNTVALNGNLAQSTITVTPTTVKPDKDRFGTAEVTLTLRDVVGTPLANVPNVALALTAPTTLPAGMTVTPSLGAGRVSDANGQLKATVSVADRPGCADTVVQFGALVDGRTLTVNDPTQWLTIGSGYVRPSATIAMVDADTVLNGRVASGTDSALITITLRDNSLTSCPLPEFPRARVHVVQTAPATPLATLTPPMTDTDGNGQTTAAVTATAAGDYTFGVWVDANDNGIQDADETMPAAGNVAIRFRPGPVDARLSHLAANKTLAMANGGKLLSGVADPAGQVALDLVVVDGAGNPFVPQAGDSVTLAAQDAVTGLPLTAADGIGLGRVATLDAAGKAGVTLTCSRPLTVKVTATVASRGATTLLADQPTIEFRPPISVAASTVAVDRVQIKADGQDAATLTIKLLDGTDQHRPVVGLPAQSITVTANPSNGVTVGDVTGTDPAGFATAKIRGIPDDLPVNVTFTVDVAWPAVAQPAPPQAQVPVLTLGTRPEVRFVVGDGVRIALTSSATVLRPNGRDAATLTATLTDLRDHPVAGASVVISNETGNGVSVVQPAKTTDAAGRVTATVTAIARNVPGAVLAASLVPPGGIPQKMATVTVAFRYPDPDPAASKVTLATTDTPLLADGKKQVAIALEVRDGIGQTAGPIPGIDPARVHVDALTTGTANQAPGVTVTAPVVATDESGRTTFTVTSTQPGKVTLRVRVDGEDGGSVTLGQRVDIEFLSFLAQSYTPGLHIMSVAATPRDTSPGAVFRDVPDFGLAAWQTGAQDYLLWQVVGSPAEPFALLPGRAFWLQLSQFTTLNLVGDRVPGDQPFPAANQPPQALAAGWNMVGNPFGANLPFQLNRIEVYRNGRLQGTLATIDGKRLLAPYAWRWDAALQYQLVLDPSMGQAGQVVSEIPMGHGVWWLALQSGVGLRLLPPQASGARVAAPVPPTPQQWTVGLTAALDGASSSVALGVGAPLRAALPPAAPQGAAVRLALEDATGRAATDIQSGPLTTRHAWNLAVTTERAGDVTLSWPGLGRSLPPRCALWLVDPTTGRRLLMNSRASYAWRATPGTRALQVELDPHGERTLAITDVRATPTRGRGVVPMTVTLSAEATLTVRVTGLGGRVVRELRQAGQVGANSVSWDGRDDEGRPVPAGAYRVEVVASNDAGEVARRTVPMTLN